MSITKLEKTFTDGSILPAAELNAVTKKVDEIVTQVNTNTTNESTNETNLSAEITRAKKAEEALATRSTELEQETNTLLMGLGGISQTAYEASIEVTGKAMSVLNRLTSEDESAMVVGEGTYNATIIIGSTTSAGILYVNGTEYELAASTTSQIISATFTMEEEGDVKLKTTAEGVTTVTTFVEKADYFRKTVEDTLPNKANNDGYYESMRVGTADNITPKGEGKEETITSREAGGDNEIDDGDAIIQSIHGNTIVMNQISPSLNNTNWSSRASSVTGVTRTDRTIILKSLVDTADAYKFGLYHQAIYKNSNVGDKIFASVRISSSIDGTFVFQVSDSQAAIFKPSSTTLLSAIVNKGTDNRILIANAATLTLTVGDTMEISDVQAINLTQMFGSGNEPSTVEAFAKKLGYDSIEDVPYFDYNEGELVSMKATGIKTTDTDGTEHTRSWASTISTYFPNGMRSNRDGSKIDILGATSAVRYFDVRAYQSGDESNTSVITDGTTTQYELASPVTSTYDELNLIEQVAEGGTEEAIVEDGVTSSPLVAVIKYPIDAYNTIMSNKTNIGTMSALKTTDQSSLVAAINELAEKVTALTSTSSTSTEE